MKRASLFLFCPAFCLAYMILYGLKIPFGIFYPVKGSVHLAPQPPWFGPGMLWYGWLVAGLLTGLVCALIPQRYAARISPVWTWLLPIFALALIVYFESYWFLP